MLRRSVAALCAVFLIAAPGIASAQSEISYADTMRKHARVTSPVHKVAERKSSTVHIKSTGGKKSHRGRV